jgi:hypothetical protein
LGCHDNRKAFAGNTATFGRRYTEEKGELGKEKKKIINDFAKLPIRKRVKKRPL